MSAPSGSPRRGPRGPKGPPVGTILTAMVVGQGKKGVLVELGGAELPMARSRYGAAADRIEALGYGDALTVEVVADAGGGTGLCRVAIERSVRQPREIEGVLRRRGADVELVPADGSSPFVVVLLDRVASAAELDRAGTWLVGAPHRGVRFVLSCSG